MRPGILSNGRESLFFATRVSDPKGDVYKIGDDVGHIETNSYSPALRAHLDPSLDRILRPAATTLGTMIRHTTLAQVCRKWFEQARFSFDDLEIQLNGLADHLDEIAP